MKNFNYFLLVLLALSVFAADANGQLMIKSVNGDVSLEQNIESLISSNNFETLPSYQDRYYGLIQFANIPTQEEKERLESTGVVFESYLPLNAYIFNVPINLKPEILKDLNVLSIVPLPKELKLSSTLYKGEYPAWSMKENNTIELILCCYNNININKVYEELIAGEYTVMKSDFHTNRITLRTDVNNINRLISLPFVKFVEATNPPGEPENLPGRSSHRSNAIATNYGTGRHYNGSGVNVAMFDDGNIGPHIDYSGRIGAQYVSQSGGVEHGDHVSGTIMAAGNIDPRARGMAYTAQLYVYDAAPIYNGFDSIYTHYSSHDIVITSTSYSDGCNAGYTTFSQKLDNQLRTMNSLIHVFSAGNNGTSNCNYGAGAGWGNITGGHKIAKNAITVANLDSIEEVNFSSSRGPAADGRLKPDVSAIGTDVLSTMPNNTYMQRTGTSMSCPGVSGTLAQLYQAYKDQNSGVNPDGGLMKAILMNNCDDLGNAGPDFIYGYGRINALNSAIAIENGQHIKDSLTQGNTNQHNITVPAGTKELKVMLYWVDYEATPGAGTDLVNNLDLVVKDPGSATYQPWVLDHTPNATNLNTPAIRATDNLNNAEQVTIDNPTSGVYTLSVTGTAVPQGPQKYYITYGFIEDDVTVTYPIGGEGFVPGEEEIIRWDAGSSASTFKIEYSTNNGGSWTTIAASVNGTKRHYIWTVPSVVSGKALIKVTQGSNSDTSDETFTIIDVPANLQVDWACPDSLGLSWSAVTGAAEYEISQLGTMYMDSIGRSTSTSFTVYNINPLGDYWFSVKAITSDSGEGRRAYAINKQPGVSNCALAYDVSSIEIKSPAEGNMPDCQNLSAVPVSVDLENFGTNAISNFTVSYSLNGAAPVSEIYTGTINAGATAVHTFSTTINMSSVGTKRLDVWTTFGTDANPYNDSLMQSTVVYSSTSQSLPYNEDFESFTLCTPLTACEAVNCSTANGWVNEENTVMDDIDWRTFEGTTSSGFTGPSLDHKPGTILGNYLYTEATGCYEKQANLMSPCFDLTFYSSAQLTFWYHQYGSDMGTLSVDVLSDGMWTKDIITPISQDVNSWQQSTINLNSFVGKVINIRFRGVTGDYFRSDMAIDDIDVTGTVGIAENTLDRSILMYPNPSKGVFNVALNDLSGSATIELLDINGRSVLNLPVNEAYHYRGTIDLTDLADGVYTVKLTNEEGMSGFKRVVKINK